MDDSSSVSSAQSTAQTVASVLGIKGSLRFRKHGASQKAHVLLRRVELSDTSNSDDGKSSCAYFSLFAKKRIEVKPGKEILLAVASDDGNFTDQAVIFEGDLFHSETSSEAEVETQVAEEDTSLDLPSVQAVPPKMRRTWTKQFQQVSPTTESALETHPPSPISAAPSYASAGVQAGPSYADSSVQVTTTDSYIRPNHFISLSQDVSPQNSPVIPMKRPLQLEKISIPSLANTSISEDDRLGSLSPMSLGSESSSPTQSPVFDRPPEVSGYLSPPATEASSDNPVVPPQSIADSENALESRLSENPTVQDIETTSPTPVDMDLSPSSSQDSDIPGFITGPTSHIVTSANISKDISMELPPASKPADVPIPHSATRDSKPVVAPKPSPMAAPRKPLQNPFVSGGFMTEFVGSPSSLTGQKTPPAIPLAEQQATVAQPPVILPMTSGPSELKQPDLIIPPSLSSRSASETLSKATIIPQAISAKIPVPSTASSSTLPPNRSQPAPRALPPRPTEKVIASSLPHKPVKGDTSYGRTSASSDYRPPISSNGSISNPLGIRPSVPVIAMSARGDSSPTVTAPLQQSTNKKRVVVGSGWPYTRQTNGHAGSSASQERKSSVASSHIVPPRPPTPEPPIPPRLPAKSQAITTPAPSSTRPRPRSSTPDSIRSSKTPPGLSNFPHSSPSPPGLLHSSTQRISSQRTVPSTEAGPSNLNPPLKVHQPSPSPAIPIKHELLDARLSHSSSSHHSGSISYQSTPVIPPSLPRAPPPEVIAGALQQLPIGNGTRATRMSQYSASMPVENKGKGKKRAISSADSDFEGMRPRKRAFGWPAQGSIHAVRIKSDEDPGIREIAFAADGQRMAVICNDRTIRIWSNANYIETARLAQNSPVMSVAWMAGDIGVISLDQDGVISKWTPNNQKHWQWVKLLDAGKEEAVDFAYMQDRIAVAFPRLGVKVWLWIKGTWQPQRSILRQNVTAIKFVEDGEALLGGTSDGVLWHCQVPNGTLRAYAFLKLQVHGLDVNSQGNQVLVSQSGGRAHLIGIQKSDNKGKVEQVYTTKDGEPNTDQRQNFTASFSSTGRTVLFGCTDNHVLVWDKNKGDVVCGLDHGEDETVQAVATFDHNSRIDSCQIVTGTKQGLLSWWKPPLVGN